MKNIFTGIGTNSPIGSLSGSIGTDLDPKIFTANLRELTANGIKPKIVINSPGGSVFGGMEIIDAMIDADVDTHIAGMAASMAGVASQFGKRRTANDFSMLMIHAAHGSEDKALMDRVNNSLKMALTRRSNLSEERINSIMSSGKDVWFDAQEMLEAGLIDEIISTDVTINVGKEEIASSYELFSEAVNKLSHKINFKRMDNEFKGVKNLLGLDSADSENAVIDSIKAKDTKIGDLKAEVELKDGEIKRLAKELEGRDLERATDLIDNAIKQGKIKEDVRSTFLTFAKADFEGCKKAIEGITPAAVAPESIVDALDIAGSNTEEEILKRGYRDIATNDPELLNNISEEKPELFNKLIDNYNKVK